MQLDVHNINLLIAMDPKVSGINNNHLINVGLAIGLNKSTAIIRVYDGCFKFATYAAEPNKFNNPESHF